jgi:hypothetical protein
MTEDGPPGDGGDGAPEAPGEGLPAELRGLDERLRRARFDPARPGLEAEVLAALPGEDREAGTLAGDRRSWFRRRAAPRDAVRAAAVLVLIVAAGLLARAGPGGGGDGGAPAPTAAPEAGPMAEAEQRFALRWGPDARVLALGTGVSTLGETEGRGLRCGREGDRLACWSPVPEAARFASARGPAVLRDFCCLDYDGGGPADDGVRVVAGQGEAVVSFWIYEDRDATGSFSDGDLLRTVVDGEPGPRAPDGSSDGVRMLDRCCADLDGGPHADDGIFVLAGDGERVALAVLYEDETGDGRLGPGDRLRAIRTTPLGEDREDGTNR